MRKIIIFIILFGLTFGSLVYSQNLLLREVFAKQEKAEQEKNEQERKEIGEVAPKFEFISPKEERIKGEIEIKGEVNNANSVEYYYQLFGAISPVYLGGAQSKGENLWEFNWDTNLTPNGEYQLFAKVINQYGEYESGRIKITIENEITKEPEKAEELKKEHQEINEDIKAVGEEMKQKEEKATEEVSQTAKTEGEVVRKRVEEFIEKAREEKQIEKEIEKAEKEKEEKEKEVKDLIKEIEKIQEIPKSEARIIENEKKTKLDIEKTLLEKKEKQIDALKKNLEEKRTKKEEIKKEIIEKIKPEERKEISQKIEQLEKEIKEKEKVMIEKKEILVKDSDGDGVSDEFEISIGTSPFNPDSDNDGFLDGDEYKFGYNPLKPGAADKILYSDAKKAKPQKTDVYYVERVTLITLPTGQLGIKIEGKGLANSFVTIYIYSAPIVMVTKADGNGNWSIVLDKPLTDGTHEVYTTVTNNHGEITARSEPYIFEKSGERIVAITISGLLSEKAISPVQTYQLSFLVLVIALVILAIGIALIIIGVSIQKRLKKEKEVSGNYD